MGPAAVAGGRRPHFRRARRQHRRVRRHGRGPARAQLVHGRDRRREGAASAAERAPERRLSLRRLPRHAVVREIHPAAAGGFATAADAYERGRPGYPEEAIAWMAERLDLREGRNLLDLAAGTGKLTRTLVPFGAHVVAVEPIDEMREQLFRALPDVDAFDGTAESIPLPDGSVDAVTCGQAFHWFRAEQALKEIHRVLRPAGGLALVWNVRDLSDPLQARVNEI